MKIIEATWDKKIFGCDVYEFYINDNCNDAVLLNVKDIFEAPKYRNAYVTVKIPLKQLKLVHAFEDVGFRFMEQQLTMEKNLCTPLLDCKACQSLEFIEIKKTKNQWTRIASLIDDNMFCTDRVYLDPYLKTSMSKLRYQNWIINLVDKPDSKLFLYLDNGIPVGFRVFNILFNSMQIDDILNGIFIPFQKKGFGARMFATALRTYRHMGIKIVKTQVSSNNIPIIRLLSSFGYKFSGSNYVLRRFPISKNN